MMARTFDWLTLALLVAVLFLLVRPGSQGVKFVSTLGQQVIGIMNAATGGGGWSGKK
jgi:hypothetical protein